MKTGVKSYSRTENVGAMPAPRSSSVPVFDLTCQYAALRQEIDAALEQVMVSGAFILGPAVRDLEQRVAAYCGCAHGIGVASGTDALRLALAAAGVGAGDEVITTPFTFVATASAISRCGAKPVFVDIDPHTYNIDPVGIEAALTPRTKAILPVHLYGQPAEMEMILEVAKGQGIPVIEDAAQAIGSSYHDQRIGSLGALGCLSFFPTKNLGAFGDGGMVVTNDQALADRVDILRRQGSRKKYHADIVAFNSRLDTMQAAVLGVKLVHLDSWNEKRRRIARMYDELLADLPIQRPVESSRCRHVYHQYTIRTLDRNRLGEHLNDRGIGTMVYYPVPLHRQGVYMSLGYGEGRLPQSEKACREVLSLPMYPELTEEQQNVVASAVREFFGG